jgi:hypothetical protein
MNARLLVSVGALAVMACGGTPERAAAGASADTTSAVEPANFHQVSDGIYRGGHPDAGGLLYLQQLGIKTIVDLEVGDFVEAAPWTISQEEDAAAAAGITLARFPMSAFEPALSDRFDAQMVLPEPGGVST